MSYLSNVMDARPLLRTVRLRSFVFCCAAPFVLLFSSLWFMACARLSALAET